MGVCFGIAGGSAAGEEYDTEISGAGKGKARGDGPNFDVVDVVVVGVVVMVVAVVALVLAAGDSSGLGGSGWLEASAINAVALAPLPGLVLLELPGDAGCTGFVGVGAGVPGRLELELALPLCPWFPRRIRSTNDGRARSVGRGLRPSMQDVMHRTLKKRSYR